MSNAGCSCWPGCRRTQRMTPVGSESMASLVRRAWVPPPSESEPMLLKSDSMPLRTEQDVVLARQAIRKVSQEIGFKLVDRTKIVTATSELARNTVIYGGGGVLKWEHLA